ncbi:hypothetical protein [Ruminococcus flavefaciens]|uniref:Uncharacterized protein n=1 Tax=Ruminococcus flavefaciens 007c TaxID=1341157 RepID=W7UHG6_RUMFL|nr:hypothetical protein [Ruminococcus flavefaciens]EWM54611.1 hypothetical protein RF007C_03910 [Ruminococcus flavefaciens 007c]
MSYSDNLSAAKEALDAKLTERPRSMFALKPSGSDAAVAIIACIVALLFFGRYVFVWSCGIAVLPPWLIGVSICAVILAAVFLAITPWLIRTAAEVKDDVIKVRKKEYHASEIQEIRCEKLSLRLISENSTVFKLNMSCDNSDEFICWARYYRIPISYNPKTR